MMSRIGLAAILWFAPAAVGSRQPAPVEEAAPAADPEAHIEAGEEALVQGRPDDAAAHFAKAYGELDQEQRVGDLGALLVSETVKARLAAWRNTTELDHLLSARDMLRNHALLVEEAGADASEFFDQMLQIDGMITRAREAAPKPPSPAEAERPPPRDPAPRLPSQRNRYVGGLAVAGVGAGAMLLGIVLGAVYGVRGKEFSDNLSRDNTSYETSGCTPAIEDVGCQQLAANIAHWRLVGRKANTIAIIGGTVPGVLGIVTFTAGLVAAFTTDPERRYRASARGLEIRF